MTEPAQDIVATWTGRRSGLDALSRDASTWPRHKARKRDRRKARPVPPPEETP